MGVGKISSFLTGAHLFSRCHRTSNPDPVPTAHAAVAQTCPLGLDLRPRPTCNGEWLCTAKFQGGCVHLGKLEGEAYVAPAPLRGALEEI